MRVLALAMLALLLGGCASWRFGPESTDQRSWAAHSRQVLSLQAWEMRGRVVASGRVKARASLRWRQDAGAFDLRVAGPFGFGAARVVGTPERIEISTGDDMLVTADPQFDIFRATGIWLPVAQLPYWLRGIPAPGLPVAGLALVDGRAAHLEQAGWALDYEDYRKVGEYWLPGRVSMTTPADSVVVEVRAWEPA